MNQYRIVPLAGGEVGEWKYFSMSAFQAECAQWARMGREFKVYFRTT